MPAIGPDEVSLLMLVIEGALLGLFTTLFAFTIYILVFRQAKTRRLNVPILTVSISMYIIGFVHMALNARRAYLAFIEGRDGSPVAFLSLSTDGFYLSKEGLYVAQTTIGDGFLIYRLYIVWARDKRLLAFATIFLLGSIVSGIVALVNAAHVSSTTPIFATEIKRWIVSFFTLTLFTNFSCTALIAFKVWWAERQLAGFAHFSNNFKPVMIIVIESGAVYSAALFALLGTYLSGTWGYYFILDSMPQVIGIVFSLIIVRMGLKTSSGDSKQSSKQAWQARATSRQSQGGSQFVPMHPLVVQVQKNESVRDDNGKTISRGSVGDISSALEDTSLEDKRAADITFDV
ncbi:hypothetical protein M0805_005871 [Coniferiporia weirii]|nr:hypothetical protein M0805_005871 [Coniferiporia weirii]